MAFADVAAKVVEGFAGAAGNTDAQNEVSQWQQKRHADQLQLAITPLQESLRADQTRLALYANPDDPTKPLVGKEAEYNATHDRMAQTIGQMRQLYGQKPSVNPVEAALGNVADKLHITNHLKNHVAQARKDADAKYQGQTQQMASATATGALPFAQTPAGQAQAAKTQGDIAVANARAKDVPNYKNIKGPNGETATINVKKDAIPAGWTLAGTSTATVKQPEVKEAGGVPYAINDPNTGKQYTPSQMNDPDTPQGAKDMWSAIQKAQIAKQDEADRKQKELWDRLAHTEEFQQRMAALREDIHDREQNLALTSKIPSMEANRYTQAQIIQEQTDKIRELLKDPDVTKYMGPIAGRTYGAAASLYSPKVRELFAAQKSLSALLPILHGYRGGVQTQESFDHMSGNMNVDVGAYQGALKAIDDMANSIKDQVQGDYPNAPMFAGSPPQGPTMRKNRQAQKGGGKSDPAVDKFLKSF